MSKVDCEFFNSKSLLSAKKKRKISEDIKKKDSEVKIKNVSRVFANKRWSRSLASQYCAILGPILTTVLCGTLFGFVTILIYELKRDGAEIQVTENELTWIIGTLLLFSPIGALTSSFLSQYLGSRKILIVSTLPSLTAWIILFRAQSYLMIILAVGLLSAASGLIESSVQVYVTETCEPRVRGSGCSALVCGVGLGTLLPIALGTYVYWRNLALLNIIFSIVIFFYLSILPESPYWLAAKGRVVAAKSALRWLRGWSPSASSSDKLKEEFNMIVEYTSRNSDGKVSPRLPLLQVPSFNSYNQPSFYLPFVLSVFLFFLSNYNGQSTIMVYSILILEWIEPPIDKFIATKILASLQLIGMIGSIFLWPVYGKRKTTFFSLIVTGLAFTIVATCEHIKLTQDLKAEENTTTYKYLGLTSFVALSIAILASSMGIRSTPWIITSEIFSTDARGFATGVISGISNLQCTVAYKTYLYTVKELTLVGTFIAYAMVNLIGFGILYWVLPETEGVVLTEIQRFFTKNGRGQKKLVQPSTETTSGVFLPPQSGIQHLSN